MTHRVYRLYDADDRLLYVGVTSTTLQERLRAHRRDKDWFGQVARTEIDRSQPRVAAHLDEQRQIITLRPLHNLHGQRAAEDPAPAPPGFAGVLRSARLAAALSQAELAEAADVSLRSIRKWESGAGLPNSVLVIQLGRALGLGLDLLEPMFADLRDRTAA